MNPVNTQDAPPEVEQFDPEPIPTEPVTFISFLHDQQVIIVPRRPRYATDGAGNVIAAGVVPGKTAEFRNRKFTTDDLEVIEGLRNHARYGTDRGWREDFDSARPVVQALQEEIAELAASGDIDNLRAIVQAEESSGDGGRSEVLNAARKGLARLEELDAAAEAAVEGTASDNSAEAGSDVTEDPEDAESR